MDLMGWGWSESDLLFMMTDGDGQFGLYQKYNPDYAKAVVAGRSTSDMDERAAAYLEAMKIVLADCAAVSLWSAVTVWTVRSASIKGVHLGAQGAVTYLDAYQEL
jgi:ABC-type transport system substrate-binding protein